MLPNITARKLARCTGKIISMQAVLGNISRLMTKCLYMYIETRSYWDSHLKLNSNDPCIQELYFWKNNVRKLNCKKLLVTMSIPEVVVYSDSSNVATGAFMVKVRDSIFHRNWSPVEAIKSSTYREIMHIA